MDVLELASTSHVRSAYRRASQGLDVAWTSAQAAGAANIADEKHGSSPERRARTESRAGRRGRHAPAALALAVELGLGGPDVSETHSASEGGRVR